MSSNDLHRDIRVSVGRTFQKLGICKNVKYFYLRNLIWLIVFYFAYLQPVQCSSDNACFASPATVLPRMSMVPSIFVFSYLEGDYRPLLNNTDFSIGGSTPYYWETFLGGVWSSTNVPPQNVTPPRIIIDKPGTSAGANSANTYNDIIILNGGELIVEEDAAALA